MNMTRWFISILLLITASTSMAVDCPGPVVNITLSRLTLAEPTIYVNGTLRIYVGNSDVDVVDVFSKENEAFDGLSVEHEVVTDKDDRNILLRWISPKKLAAPKYYLNLSLSSVGRGYIQGKEMMKLNVSFRASGRQSLGAFYVNPDLSLNCRPHQ